MIKHLLDNSIVLYHYGSFVYGTFTQGKSDYDFIVVVPDCMIDDNELQLTENEKQYTFYRETYFKERINKHEIDALECIFLPENFIKGNNIYLNYFSYNEQKLRESISRVCSNSYVKAKKKLIVEKDYDFYKSMKSLFHSIRIYEFGRQIAVYGRIVDYTACNDIWKEISKETSQDWEYYHKKYKPIYNQYHSNFVKIASKKIN